MHGGYACDIRCSVLTYCIEADVVLRSEGREWGDDHGDDTVRGYRNGCDVSFLGAVSFRIQGGVFLPWSRVAVLEACAT